MIKDKILIIEDDQDLVYIYTTYLEQENYEVFSAGDYLSAMQQLAIREYDLVILDMMLPDISGMQLCGEIRRISSCPILFISCISDNRTIVDALMTGGDDYMIKPVNYNEMIARIKVNIRRTKKGEEPEQTEIKRYKQFEIDLQAHVVWKINDYGKRIEKINLSPIEYKILILLTKHPDELLLYEEIYKHIWEANDAGDVRTVLVHVSNLRKKIDAEGTDMIHVVRGAGYIFSNE